MSPMIREAIERFQEKTLPLRRRILKRRFLALAIPGIILFSIFYAFILKDLPSPTRLASSHTPQTSQIFERNGKLLYNIYDKRNQSFVSLSAIPKHVQEATIAIEDRNFYNHGAIDLRGIARALHAIIVKEQIQGGSTLTQQLVKTSLLVPDQTIPRKIREIILAYATELLYSKDQILEMYLNQVPYGGTSYGIEAASRTFFGKPAKELTLSEGALLAGLPEAPSVYSPFGSRPELAKSRQTLVLEAMLEEEYITKAEYDKAVKEPLKYQKFSNEIKAPHFVLYVKDLLIDKYGQEAVLEGGLKVTTSLDLDIQTLAQDAVATEVANLRRARVSNGAALVTKPSTGEILAMVGSRGYFDEEIDGNVNVTTSLRQPGSSIKPINYAVGIIKGYSGATPFIDEKTCFPNQGGKNFCPQNYDGKFRGVVQMRDALGSSLNIPAVKMLKVNGIDAMIATASAMGIQTFTEPDKYGLSLTLGGGEVKMIDMATSFGVLANEGYRIDLHPILKIVDRRGKVIEEYKPPKSPIFGKRVLPQGVGFIISDILADNNARLTAFGPNSELRIPGQTVSVKTGTTNDYKDNWTIGYTPSYLVASWVGNNDGTPMASIVSGVTGAAPIWNKIMSTLLEEKEPELMQRPSNVVQRAVCNLSGLIPQAGGAGCSTRFEYFLKGLEPKKLDAGLVKTWVDKDTQRPPKPGQTENLELKELLIVEDPTKARYCVSCPPPASDAAAVSLQ